MPVCVAVRAASGTTTTDYPVSSLTSDPGSVTNAQTGTPKGQYTRNQFGFDVGGPIFKDRLFFLGSTEWTRVRSTAAQTASTADAAKAKAQSDKAKELRAKDKETRKHGALNRAKGEGQDSTDK